MMPAHGVVGRARPPAVSQATRTAGRRAAAVARPATIVRLALGLATVALLAGCPPAPDAVAPRTPSMSDLAGKTWVATSIDAPDRQLVQGTTIRLTFTDDSVSANAGCNTMHGGAKIEDTELVVGALAATLIACDDAKAAQDHWLSEFLTSKPTITLSDDDLRLSKDDTKVQLHGNG